MQPVEITYFAITLFLALAGLLKWKYRKDDMAARLNRGLKGYVQSGSATRRIPTRHRVGTQVDTEQEADDPGLIVA